MDASLCYCWVAKSLSRRGVRPFFWKSCPQENSSQGKAKKPRARAKPKTKPKTNIKTKPRARAGLVVHPRWFQWSARLRGSHNRDPQVRRVRQRVYRTLRPGVQPLRAGEHEEGADPALVEDLKANLKALKNCSEEGCREAEDAS